MNRETKAADVTMGEILDYLRTSLDRAERGGRRELAHDLWLLIAAGRMDMVAARVQDELQIDIEDTAP